MRFNTFTSLTTVAALASAQAPSIKSYTSLQISGGDAWRNISQIADETMRSNVGSRQNAACTYDNADVRKEWRTLSPETRKSFTDAVICLQEMKPQVMTSAQAADYPGVKSRFDEYVATHINYTMNIHDTADFFAWHRTFIHFLEQDLQKLCGYTGVLPYWNWAEDFDAPQDLSLIHI